MAELSEIEFGRLDIRDGDVLVLRTPRTLSREQRDWLTAYINERLGEHLKQTKVLILESGFDIAVLRKEAAAA